MLIGVPREIKPQEYRIGMTPAGVQECVTHGHKVMIQRDGATRIGFSNEQYQTAGAEIIDTAKEIFDRAQMIVKVKEPQPQECLMLKPEQLLFTYLHLAPDPEQTHLLLESGATCIAYETVTSPQAGLPLLAPMSEVAGRMSIQAGAHHLQVSLGGSGTLLGGVPGVEPAKVLIIGGGVVGINAAKMAIGMGADVTLADRSIDRLRQLDDIFSGKVKTVYSTHQAIEHHAMQADLLIGAVLIPGSAAPRLISRDLVSRMKAGSVMVDVAIDQGGCFETSQATTHQEPVYIVDGVVHYCVANMPGAYARTSTLALTNATLKYVLALADKGVNQALQDDPHLAAGLNIHNGHVTYQAIADVLGYDYRAIDEVLTLTNIMNAA